jgi:hypothetical protein
MEIKKDSNLFCPPTLKILSSCEPASFDISGAAQNQNAAQ